MDNTVVIAAVAAASAILGGLISAVLGPLVKHRLEQAAQDTERKRDLLQRWRTMILEIDRAAEGNQSPVTLIQLHPDFLALEPHLSEDAKKTILGPNRRVVVGQALSGPLEAIKSEVARIERDWGL